MDGGDGTGMARLEERVTRVEKRLDNIESKLDRVIESLAEIKGSFGSLSSKADVENIRGGQVQFASAAVVGELKGKIEALPSTRTVATLLAIVTAVWAFMPKLQEWVAKLPLP